MRDSQKGKTVQTKDVRFDVILLSIVLTSTTVLILTLLYSNTQSFVLLVIFGVIDLVAVLTIAGRVFLRTGLECKDEALGLPNGSVRALIALSLIIIFAIMSIYMYTQLTPQQTVWHSDVNQTVLLANGTLITPQPNGGIDVILQPSEAQQNFSLQTITTASTLVVALAGFYFGTKAVNTAQGKKTQNDEDEEERTEPEYEITVTPKNSELLSTGEVIYKDKLEFDVQTLPKGMKYEKTIEGADKDSLTDIPDQTDKYLFSPKNRINSIVNVTFTLETDKNISKKIPIIFEKLEVKPEETSVKKGESAVINVKAIPEDKEIKYSITGDVITSIKPAGKGFFIYSPSEKDKQRTSDNVFLIFEIADVPLKTAKTTQIIVTT